MLDTALERVSRLVIDIIKMINIPQAVFYDLDGTILNSANEIMSAIKKAANKNHIKIKKSKIKSSIGPSFDKILKRILISDIPCHQYKKLMSSFRNEYDTKLCTRSSLYPNVKTILGRFKQKRIYQFLITNKPPKATKRIIQKHKLEKLFDQWHSSSSRNDKAYLVKKIIRQYNLQKSRCFYVGDSTDDSDAAEKNRINFIAACYGYGLKYSKSALINIKNINQLALLISSL
jgi:phosphoglycolate phosphatase